MGARTMRARSLALAFAFGIFFILALQGANSFKYEYENKVDGETDVFFYTLGFINDGNLLLANASMVDALRAWRWQSGNHAANVTVYCGTGTKVVGFTRNPGIGNQCTGPASEFIPTDKSRIVFNRICSGISNDWYESFQVRCDSASGGTNGLTNFSQISTDTVTMGQYPPSHNFRVKLNSTKSSPTSTSVVKVYNRDFPVGGGIDRVVTLSCPYRVSDPLWNGYSGETVLNWKFIRIFDGVGNDIDDDSGSCQPHPSNTLPNGAQEVGKDYVKFRFWCTNAPDTEVLHMNLFVTCKDPFPTPKFGSFYSGSGWGGGTTTSPYPFLSSLFSENYCSSGSNNRVFTDSPPYAYYDISQTCTPDGLYMLNASKCTSSTCTDNVKFVVPVSVLRVLNGKLNPPLFGLAIRTGEVGFSNPGFTLVAADPGSQCNTNYLNVPCSVANGKVVLGNIPEIWDLKVNYTYPNGEIAASSSQYNFDARIHSAPTAVDYLTRVNSYELRANHTKAEASVAVYDALSFNDAAQFPANAPACTVSPFGDVSSGYWACPEIKKLKDSGIITESGFFSPSGLATRAKAAFWIVKGKLKVDSEIVLPPCLQKFSDVPCSRSDANEINYVATTIGIENVKCGGTTPFGGADPYKFCPDFTVARPDMAKWLKGILNTVTNYQTYFDSNDQRISSSRQDTIVLAKMTAGCTSNAECVAQYGQGWTCNLQSGVCEPPEPPVTCKNPVTQVVLGPVTNNYCFYDSNAALGPVDKLWKCTMPTQGTEGVWTETICPATCSFDVNNNPIAPPTATGLCAQNPVKNQCSDANGQPPAFCVAAGGPVCGNQICEQGETPQSCPADCPSGPVCGNNIKEQGEVCDGTDLGDENCVLQGFTGGALKCKSNCLEFDTSDCRNENCEDNDNLALCLNDACVWEALEPPQPPQPPQPAEVCRACDYWTACWDYDNPQTCDGTGQGGNPSLSNPCGIYLWDGNEGVCEWDDAQVEGQKCVFKPNAGQPNAGTIYVGGIEWGECLRGERTGTQVVLNEPGGEPQTIQVSAKCPSIIPIAFITKETAIMIIMLLVAYYFYTMRGSKKGEKEGKTKGKRK
ncbi:MAG TPA: hypothetical protein HA218_02730 [Nanoarchaeota archaeon]|nr:hypothetical protein [Nanoarchaeota archaeon]